MHRSAAKAPKSLHTCAVSPEVRFSHIQGMDLESGSVQILVLRPRGYNTRVQSLTQNKVQ